MGDLGASACLVDANLILWAHHRQFPRHDEAREWWAATLSSAPQVGIPWPTTLAFIRVSTHPRALERPITIQDACDVARSWLDRPNTWVPGPTDRHAEVLLDLLVRADAGANHTPDAHLAALAIEWGLELLSADRDFARYPGLRWRHPLETPTS